MGERACIRPIGWEVWSLNSSPYLPQQPGRDTGLYPIESGSVSKSSPVYAPSHALDAVEVGAVGEQFHRHLVGCHVGGFHDGSHHGDPLVELLDGDVLSDDGT